MEKRKGRTEWDIPWFPVSYCMLGTGSSLGQTFYLATLNPTWVLAFLGILILYAVGYPMMIIAGVRVSVFIMAATAALVIAFGGPLVFPVHGIKSYLAASHYTSS